MALFAPELLAELNKAISKHKLESVAEEIRDNASECYAMIAVEEDRYLTTGNTRFGGDPDLPDAIQWPVEKDGAAQKYCNFFAQINFAELPPLGKASTLPATGILYIFVRCLSSAADPVAIDALYFNGDLATLRRTTLPANVEYCDPYSVRLIPQKVKAVPAVSVATFRKDFRKHVAGKVVENEVGDGQLRLAALVSDLTRKGQIGQLLGFANSHDGDSLYRHVALSQLGKRELMFNDYWSSMAEYEAATESCRQSSPDQFEYYTSMREGVTWLMDHQNMICKLADEWKLLLQVDSNHQMNLNINDADPLYCFIRNDGLMKRDFSSVTGEVMQG